MIQPWQVWLADLEPTEGHEQGGTRPVVVISSELHLGVNVGRMATVAPLTSVDKHLRYHVPVLNPHRGTTSYVITDQIRTITTARFLRSEPWWVLKDDEIEDVAASLRYMLDI